MIDQKNQAPESCKRLILHSLKSRYSWPIYNIKNSTIHILISIFCLATRFQN